MTPPVRPAGPADRPALRRLQGHLPEPSPRLLAYGLAAGGVLVSDAGRPVGYLLAVGSTFGRGAVGDPFVPPPEPPGRFGAPETSLPSEPSVPPDAAAPDPTPGPPDASGATPEGRGAHLAELVVAPGFRREGCATALLARLLAVADGPVTVAVRPGNDPALSLYRSLGFERAGRREGYFAAGAALWLVRE